jgi:DNA-binding CsgD family transcriptional regulator/DNA-directed RNA polymerase subunit N (RpoN/RPB10)
MDEILVVLVTCLSAATVVAAIEYYRYLRRAQKEYERAKAAVDDIVLSFNRQFKREAEKLEVIAFKVESIASKIKDFGKRMEAVEMKAKTDMESAGRVVERLNSIEGTLRDVGTSQEAITTKLASLEERARQMPVAPETGLEAVIPIRKEKAIAQLTDTELSVLEMLASEGPKTAPEIKERVKLSREHTARLMKKLYEEGYLERETGKIPFRYTVKKEMEKLLKKTETPVT